MGKPEITDDERRAALDVANEVTILAGRVPGDYAERKLHAAAHAIRRHYGYSRPMKKAEILRRVQRSACGITLTDLKNETGFHKSEVYELVQELAGDDRVVLKKVAPAGPRGGRPSLLIALAGTDPAGFVPPKT